MLLFYGKFLEKLDATSAPLPTGHATNQNRTPKSAGGAFGLDGGGGGLA